MSVMLVVRKNVLVLISVTTALLTARPFIERCVDGLLDALDAVDAEFEDLEDDEREDVDGDDDTVTEDNLGATEEFDQDAAWSPGFIPIGYELEIDEVDLESLFDQQDLPT